LYVRGQGLASNGGQGRHRAIPRQGTWNHLRHHLYKYDPSARKITFFQHGTPNAPKEANIMYVGAGPVDVMINGGDGYLYIGTAGGSLCRLDPKTAQVDYLGRPAPTQRLPGLVPARFLDVNIKAFERGFAFGQAAIAPEPPVEVT
jgi:hypothetical protein